MQPERPVTRDKPVEAVVEIPTEAEVEKKPELSGYMEKITKEIELTKPIVDDYTKEILLKPMSNQNPTVKLPMTEDEIEKGLHEQIWESVKWLAEWCVRQVKMLGDKAVMKKVE